jgi:aryl-alcohol dehydrogenase-like predicted oxidoreductase
MKQINLGSQGLRVPAIGLGCMGMSDFYGSSSETDNLRVLERAAELGCTFWDTSDIYGPFTNEILLSKALKGRRDRIILATRAARTTSKPAATHRSRASASITSIFITSTGWTRRLRSRRPWVRWPSS